MIGMRSVSVLRFFLVVAAVAASARAQVDDPGGLWNAKWNMTLSQVRDAVQGAATVEPPIRNFWTLGRLKAAASVNGFPVEVVYEFHPQLDQFCAATVTPAAGIDRRSAFYSIKQSLIERYGKPTDEDTTEQGGPAGSPTSKRWSSGRCLLPPSAWTGWRRAPAVAAMSRSAIRREV